MSKKYVSLAIDHGTTNSCIARMTPKGPQVIPAETNNPTLPSAVYYDAKGALFVGSAARRAMMTSSREKGQGVTGYKLQIGDNKPYEFPAARKSMTASELGSVIMQTLLRAHQKATGEDARACVITIPAKFKQNSVEGTRAAAEMAGLAYYPLIMEPVAAAMCYGFNANQQQAQWMVFDLGGGTLDVSLVIARRGKLVVPDGGHAGDDNLGGSKFDRELAGYVLGELEKHYKLTGFRNDQKQHSNAWGRLLLAVEDAKIKLSDRADALVELDEPLCRDDNGKDVVVKLPVTRQIYEGLVRPDAERAVQICQTLMKNNRISAKEIEKLILIGGPSKTPLFRNMLAERLGIRLEFSIDPMTAVAEGAAIYADQVELPPALRVTQRTDTRSFSLRMECERQSSVPVYCAVGMVDGPSASGMRVETERLDGKWKSQQIPVDGSGVFTLQLSLIERQKPTMSEFRTTLLDATGKELARIDEPQIWYPSLAVENRLANSLCVAIKNNETELLIEPGAELPAEGRGQFETIKEIRRGSKEDVLKIPVLESVTNALGEEDRLASSCLHVGTLRILGSDERVRSDIPLGSEVEVRLKVDESRAITAIAYIPLLDEEFEAKFVGEKFEYTLEQLQARLEQIRLQLANIAKLQAARPMPDVANVLEQLEREKLLESIVTDLERGKAGERDAEVRAYKRIVELEGTIQSLQRLQQRARVEVAIETLSKVAKGEDANALTEIRSVLSKAQSPEDVKQVAASLGTLEFAVRGRHWRELVLDLVALANMKVTQLQNDVFNKASELYHRIDDSGGVEKASDADIAAVQQMHREIEAHYPDLYRDRQKWLQEHGKPPETFIDTSVDRKRK